LFATLLVDGGRCARHVRALETAIQDRVRAQRQALDALQKQDTARARQSEAELSMLRAHIEPHFLFNTLAHIKASLPSAAAGAGPDEDVAERMLDALIDFLRSNSQALTRTENTLGEELAMVESYLTLIRLRLGDRLRYTIECPPSLHTQRLPSAAVLVLVENAVKHGIERSADGGAIAVRCTIEDGASENGGSENDATENGATENGATESSRLSIVCENDGPPFEIASGRVGGLSNLQERLRLMHGTAFAMEFENLASGRVRAALSWPCAEETD
jgi:sensor histidine kinase YesM